MSLEAGNYKAKIKDYGYSDPGDKKDAQGNPKKPSAMVQFEVQVPEGAGPMGAPARTEQIMWFGSFNGGALGITLKTLLETLHFKGKDGAELHLGIGSGVLDEETEYELEVEMNEWNGKVNPRIKYINRPGASRRAEKLDAAGAKQFVGGLNLAGELAAMRATLKGEGKELPAVGRPAPTAIKAKPITVMAQQPAAQAAAPTLDESEEIPW